MHDTARKLAAAGFRVFPVERDGKKPLVKGWPEKASTLSQQIDLWDARFPGCNWGIHAEDLLVLDVDPKNGGATPDNLTDTFTVRTPSGGAHRYYRHPGGVKNSSGKVGRGLDVRSTNGYVVAPGSTIHGKTYDIINAMPPADAPDWLVEVAGRPTPRTESDGGTDGDQDAAVLRAKEMLADLPVAVQGEGGDHKTFAVVCRVRDIGVDAAHALEALEAWNQRCEPPWEPDDLQVKINNAYSYAAGPAGGAVALDSDFEPTLEYLLSGGDDNIDVVNEQSDDNVEVIPSILSTAPGIDVPGLLKTNYLIKEWLPRQSNALLFGEWGGGKTFTALDMAAHVAAGAPWFGMRVRQGGVLYVGYEGAHGVSRRVQALRQTYPDFPWETMPFAWFMLNRPLTKAGGGRDLLNQALEEFRKKYGRLPVLVIIDPLRDALGGSDSDADLTAPYLKYCRELVKRTRCTMLTIHHPGHGDKERGRGDSGIEASMDTVIRLDKDAGTLETKKQRDGACRRLNYVLELVTLGTDDDGDPVQSCVVQKIDDNPNDPRLTPAQTVLLETLRAAADPDGYLGPRDVQDALTDKDASSRRVLMRVFVQKGYFLEDGNGWTLAASDTGADMFGEDSIFR